MSMGLITAGLGGGGDIDFPAESDVRLNVDYDNGDLTGELSPTIKGPVKVIELDTGIKVIKI